MDTKKQKIIIITGASSGIGSACAKCFLQNGHKVALVGRSKKRLQDVLVTLNDIHSGNALLIEADVSRVEDCKKIIKETLIHFNGIDVLINNAGILKKFGNNIQTTDLEEWETVMNTNLRSAFLLSQYASVEMEKSDKHPCIINVSSLASTRSFANMLPYCVSKAAMDKMTECCSLELAPKGIRVISVNPATIKTQFHTRAGMANVEYQEFLESASKMHPLGRIGYAHEVADLIYFLAGSDKALFITGDCINIDGGRSKMCPVAPQLSKM